jgi:hypothetical protein
MDYLCYFRTALSFQPQSLAWSDVPSQHLVPK